MRQYKKKIDGILVIKRKKDIILIKDGMQTINPTEEMILADGWEEYIDPVPSDYVKLVTAKRDKRFEIEKYDTSYEVNEFYVSEQPIWLDKATRAGLLLRFQAEQATGIKDTALWYNGMQFSLKVEQAIQMLYAIELYASACYDNTQRHIANIGNLATMEDVQGYDYKAGYPEKLRF